MMSENISSFHKVSEIFSFSSVKIISINIIQSQCSKFLWEKTGSFVFWHENCIYNLLGNDNHYHLDRQKKGEQ